MPDRPSATASEANDDPSTTRDELRTISFRLREVQRLLTMRVAQENRRLADEGLEPVTDDEFSRGRDSDR